MKMFKSKILLIGESKNRCNYIIDIIKKPWIEVIVVSSIEMAIKVSMKEQIDLIICYDDLIESSAFQVYSVLNDNILRNEAPFIIVLNEFSKNNLLIGIELGIDSFIFPSFDSETIKHIINLQL